MKYIKLYEQFINEAKVPSNIKDFAKDRGITSLVNKVAGWAEKVGSRISGGTAIGKNYSTLVLDMKYQGAEIRINLDTDVVKLYDEEVTSLAQFKKVFDKNKSTKSVNESSNFKTIKKSEVPKLTGKFRISVYDKSYQFAQEIITGSIDDAIQYAETTITKNRPVEGWAIINEYSNSKSNEVLRIVTVNRNFEYLVINK